LKTREYLRLGHTPILKNPSLRRALKQYFLFSISSCAVSC
jgi:hypothetical protein